LNRIVAGTPVNPTSSHRLILPTDSNHHGTLYAGSLLRITLEAAYATAWRTVGAEANLVLRRVHNIECLQPVEVGTVIEIQGLVLHRSHSYLVTGLIGTPLQPGKGPWLEALLGFAQIDTDGRPVGLPDSLEEVQVPAEEVWQKLRARLQKLLQIRRSS
jgi:acyl-CoA thioesterase YciA